MLNINGEKIVHKWKEFRLHIPFLPLAEFSDTMKELVYDMNYLDSTRDLHFPMVTKWETLPASWKEFTREVEDYEFPIQVLGNTIIVTKDFRKRHGVKQTISLRKSGMLTR